MYVVLQPTRTCTYIAHTCIHTYVRAEHLLLLYALQAHSEWLPVCGEVEQSRPSTGTSSGFRNLQRSREGAVKRTCGHELLDMCELDMVHESATL